MKDRYERPVPQLTEFTFFPENDEAARIAGMDSDQLIGYVLKDPDLSPPLLHELWRNHRSADMHRIIDTMLPDEEFQEALYGDDLVGYVVVARVEGNETEEKCEQFLRDLFTLTTRITGEFYTGPLTEVQTENVDISIEDIMGEVRQIVIEHNSRLN